MAVHTYTTRTVIHHEWVMNAPVHHTDIAKALSIAHDKHDTLNREGHASVTDVIVFGRDEELVISFTQEQR